MSKENLHFHNQGTKVVFLFFIAEFSAMKKKETQFGRTQHVFYFLKEICAYLRNWHMGGLYPEVVQSHSKLFPS